MELRLLGCASPHVFDRQGGSDRHGWQVDLARYGENRWRRRECSGLLGNVVEGDYQTQ